MVKIRDVKRLQWDIENDPIMKDYMANLGCFLVCTFGNFLCACLSGCAYGEQLRSCDEQGLENEGYESDLKN